MPARVSESRTHVKRLGHKTLLTSRADHRELPSARSRRQEMRRPSSPGARCVPVTARRQRSGARKGLLLDGARVLRGKIVDLRPQRLVRSQRLARQHAVGERRRLVIEKPPLDGGALVPAGVGTGALRVPIQGVNAGVGTGAARLAG
eukprot:5318623-Prymnesium_polylepis.1